MKYRTLGKSGLMVSEIGFGGWGLGGEAYGPIEEAQALNVLQHAFSRGINFYDTSDAYGHGRSEALIGRAFSTVRDKVVIATKGGCLPHTGPAMPQDFSPSHLTRSLEQSLRRLQTDYVDLYQLHSPHISVLEDNRVIEALDEFKKSGQTKLIGLSARTPQDLLQALDIYPFDAVQVNFNLIDHRVIEMGVLAQIQKRRTGLIVRTPLCFGFLTGKVPGSTDFSQNDHRVNWPREQIERWKNAVALFKRLYDEKDLSPTQMALQFVLSYSQVSTTIPGMMAVSHVEENASVPGLGPMSIQDIDIIGEIYKSHSFFDPALASRKAQKASA